MKFILAAALLLVVFALWPRQREAVIPWREMEEVDYV